MFLSGQKKLEGHHLKLHASIVPKQNLFMPFKLSLPYLKKYTKIQFNKLQFKKIKQKRVQLVYYNKNAVKQLFNYTLIISDE